MKLQILMGTLSVLTFAFNSPLTVSARTLIPGGENVGLELKDEGLIISGIYEVNTDFGSYNPMYQSDIVIGDVITYSNDIRVNTIQDFLATFSVEQNIKQSQLNLKIKRESKSITRTLNLIKTNDNASWKSGLFIKERLLGIGTLSYLDPVKNTFGSLGHE